MAALSNRRPPSELFGETDFDEDAKTLVERHGFAQMGDLSQVLNLLELEPQGRIRRSPVPLPPRVAGTPAPTVRSRNAAESRAPSHVDSVSRSGTPFGAAWLDSISPAAIPSIASASTPARVVAAPAFATAAISLPLVAPRPVHAKPIANVTAAPSSRAKRQPTQVLVRGKEAAMVTIVGLVSISIGFAVAHAAGRFEISPTPELVVPMATAAAVLGWFIVGLFGRIGVLAPVICAVGTAVFLQIQFPPSVALILAIGAAGCAIVATWTTRIHGSKVAAS